MNKQQLFNKLNGQHFFWSYEINSETDITDCLLIEYTLLYGDATDIIVLLNLVPVEQVKTVWEQKIIPAQNCKPLNYYLAKIFFDIKNPNKYLQVKNQQHNRYERLKLLAAQH